MARHLQTPRTLAAAAAMVLLLVGAGAGAPGAEAAGLAGAAATRGHHHRAAAHRRRARHHPASSPATARSTPADAPRATPAPSPAPAPGPAAGPAVCGDGDLVPTAANLGRVRAAIVCLVNQQRAGRGLAPLRESAGLDAAAEHHTEDMVAGNYFAHVGPTGVGLLDQVVAAGYAAVGGVLDVGENIAAGDGSLATAGVTVAGWMDSPEHRANILDPGFADTGVGVVAATPGLLGTGGRGATYTQCFGAAG